ncbi:alpha/beta hydrolase [Photobacterium kasasachensis]|uniref:alpha/beta hydrolase n=1 Tax=Photobacterium kasasachensis TaxID=2910240 RepID=UPI003D0F6538
MKVHYLTIPLLAGLIAVAVLDSIAVAKDFHVPATISREARGASAEFSGDRSRLPKPDDIEGWKKAWEENEEAQQKENEAVTKKFGATVEKLELGGVPVLDIRPKNWEDNGKVLIYTHGGAYTLFSAASTLISSVPVADATRLRVISVDYTVPPTARWKEVTGQVVSVIKALVEGRYDLKDIAIYGDSAGGGLAAGSVLKARDEGVGLVAAVVLWSPWSDITETGDTYSTLRAADPLLVYADSLENAAAAYADPADQKHPYVSPVYGDYSKGFPPTLIQVGTKEIFLSNSIRHYQALDQAGIAVKLDAYEGMWHVFQAFHWRLPESDIARAKMSNFLKLHLE